MLPTSETPLHGTAAASGKAADGDTDLSMQFTAQEWFPIGKRMVFFKGTNQKKVKFRSKECECEGLGLPFSHRLKSNFLIWESQLFATWFLLLLQALSTSYPKHQILCLSENSSYSFMPASLFQALVPSWRGEFLLSLQYPT